MTEYYLPENGELGKECSFFNLPTYQELFIIKTRVNEQITFGTMEKSILLTRDELTFVQKMMSCLCKTKYYKNVTAPLKTSLNGKGYLKSLDKHDFVRLFCHGLNNGIIDWQVIMCIGYLEVV